MTFLFLISIHLKKTSLASTLKEMVPHASENTIQCKSHAAYAMGLNAIQITEICFCKSNKVIYKEWRLLGCYAVCVWLL
jgi:hypothetical protein